MYSELQLDRVTITGADDNTNIDELMELHEEFPFVEFAILFSQSKTGTARYPSIEWVKDLCNHVNDKRQTKSVPLSAHLCGGYTRDIMRTQPKFSFRDRMMAHNLWGYWNRIQLNLGSRQLTEIEKQGIFKTIISLEYMSDRPASGLQFIVGGKDGKSDLLEWIRKKFIEQGHQPKYIEHHIVSLFDASGGRGIETKTWPEYIPRYCGYAGGLNPENVSKHIDEILDTPTGLCGKWHCWIDVESGVRDNQNKLDMQKVKRFLTATKPYIAAS